MNLFIQCEIEVHNTALTLCPKLINSSYREYLTEIAEEYAVSRIYMTEKIAAEFYIAITIMHCALSTAIPG
jgi:hypothetical protein